MLFKEKNRTLCLSMENLVNSSLTFNIFFPGNILEKTDIKTAERDHWQDLVWIHETVQLGFFDTLTRCYIFILFSDILSKER